MAMNNSPARLHIHLLSDGCGHMHMDDELKGGKNETKKQLTF